MSYKTQNIRSIRIESLNLFGRRYEDKDDIYLKKKRKSQFFKVILILHSALNLLFFIGLNADEIMPKKKDNKTGKKKKGGKESRRNQSKSIYTHTHTRTHRLSDMIFT